MLILIVGLLIAPPRARADDPAEEPSAVDLLLSGTQDFILKQAENAVKYRYFYPRVELSPYATLQLTTKDHGKVNYAYDIRRIGEQDDLAIIQFSLALDIPAIGCGFFSSEYMCDRMNAAPFGMRKGAGAAVEGSLFRLDAVGANHVAGYDYAYVGNLILYGRYTFAAGSLRPEVRLGVGTTRIETGDPNTAYAGLSEMVSLLLGGEMKGDGLLQGKLSYVYGGDNSISGGGRKDLTTSFELFTISLVFTFRG